jgi:hypothetical protein
VASPFGAGFDKRALAEPAEAGGEAPAGALDDVLGEANGAAAEYNLLPVAVYDAVPDVREYVVWAAGLPA